MSIEISGQNEMKVEPFPADVVRETTHQGQVVWLNSAPEEKSKEVSTSSPESLSPKV